MSRDARETTLVFGGSGFLGTHVVAEALAHGGRVVSASRAAASAPRTSGAREPVRVEADALREGEWEALLEEERPARVVLCTALSRGADCEAYPALARTLNAELPRRVASWCAQSGARLVHVSTDLVFGATPPPPQGFREDSPPGPLSVYGKTKAEGERAVLEVFPSALVVRLPLLYGDSAGRGLGASDSLLAAISRGETPIGFQDELRTPLEVRAAAAAIVELAAGEASGLLHVAGSERVTRFELALEVLRAAGYDELEARSMVRAGWRRDVGLEAVRPEDASLDSRLARRMIATRLPGAREGLAGMRG
ncbi:MAG TPA: sugar nucleotide-binding protein [Planctomycetota bacterium]|nr:sugar nucleotide-binding protein [Planctomycetota bacterium]